MGVGGRYVVRYRAGDRILSQRGVSVLGKEAGNRILSQRGECVYRKRAAFLTVGQ